MSTFTSQCNFILAISSSCLLTTMHVFSKETQLGQSNYIVSFSSTHFYISMRAGGHYSLFIIHYYSILRVWFPGTAQIISKKEVWLVLQGNNEGKSGRLKQI